MWFVGIPFLILIIGFREDVRYDLLLLNTNNYEVLDLPLTQLPYLTKLIGLYAYDNNYQIVMDGFLDYHRMICRVEDCVCRRRVMKTTKFSKTMRQEGELE
jgi:hypothetical protein